MADRHVLDEAIKRAAEMVLTTAQRERDVAKQQLEKLQETLRQMLPPQNHGVYWCATNCEELGRLLKKSVDHSSENQDEQYDKPEMSHTEYLDYEAEDYSQHNDESRELNEDEQNSILKCPSCHGPADNGHDRNYPPNAYNCKSCDAKKRY